MYMGNIRGVLVMGMTLCQCQYLHIIRTTDKKTYIGSESIIIYCQHFYPSLPLLDSIMVPRPASYQSANE